MITQQVASSTTKLAGPQGKAYVNVSQTGDSVLQMTRELSLRSEQPINYSHLKVVVIGEKLARSYKLEQLLNQNLRDNDFDQAVLCSLVGTGQQIVYELESMKSSIKPQVKGNNISFDVNIESEGRLSENWVVSGNTFSNDFLKKAEKSSEKEVKRLVRNVVEKMQKEYQVDVAGFGNRLRIENPKV
ncbi:hypothetical protein J7E95_00680 [Streptomyces sp. ISL-14]|nr:hypothetical protein [Streptomyces sp. ISL-14]